METILFYIFYTIIQYTIYNILQYLLLLFFFYTIYFERCYDILWLISDNPHIFSIFREIWLFEDSKFYDFTMKWEKS